MEIPISVIEKLGYYVYLYLDPTRGDEIFYVGRGGHNNCVVQHLDDNSDTEKGQRIQELKDMGKQPKIEVLAHNLKNENQASLIEAAVIELLGVSNLTNQVRGKTPDSFGRVSLEELVTFYTADPVQIKHPAILIRINRLFGFDMTQQELYDATRGVWRIGERREKANYAFAVYKGIVREVYEIKK